MGVTQATRQSNGETHLASQQASHTAAVILFLIYLAGA